MRIYHAADIHLDSPLRGLSSRDGAPEERLRGATRRAFENLIDACLEDEADALLIAGDLYDGDWRDWSTGLFFSAQVGRLREVGTRTFIVRGNHDAASRITKHLALPEGCTDLGTREPRTVVVEELGLAVHGQGFPRREVTVDLAAGYPAPVDGAFNVGLLHTAVDGREGHAPYAPTSLATLRAAGYRYWALGHVHRREVLCEDPWIVFPGNLQGRHSRETGEKGATVVDVAEGAVLSVEHRALDVVRWALVEVDASSDELRSAEDVVERAARLVAQQVEAADGRLVAARVVVRGASRAHAQLVLEPERWDAEVRVRTADAAGPDAWIERVVLATSPKVDLERLSRRDDALGQLVRSLRVLQADPQALAGLAAELAELKLPRELRVGPDALDPDDAECMAGLVADAERILIPRLLAREDRG